MRLILALWLLLAPCFAWAGGAPVPVLFGGQTYVLDQLSSYPAVAYSVRQMTAGQYLPAYDMTVRRSSDNATQNIGFSGGVENVAALASFCAGTNAYLVTWKNQGSLGSAGDASQSTAASQPQVCASGVVETWNGQPTVYFGGSQYLVTAGNVQVVNVSTGAWSAAAVANYSGNATQVYYLINQDSSSRIWYLRAISGSSNHWSATAFNTVPSSFSSNGAIGSNLVGGQFNGTQVTAFGNGAAGTPATLTGTIQTASVPLQISINTTAMVGTISETWAGGFVQSASDKSTYDLNAASCSATGFCIPGVTQ